MRPMLKPGLSPRRRDLLTVELGRAPWRHVVLPRTPTTAAVLALLDGTRTWESLVEQLVNDGHTPLDVDYTLTQLRDAGTLDDAAVRPRLLRGVAPEDRAALLRNVDGWSAASDEPSAGRLRVARQRGGWIAVAGHGPFTLLVMEALAMSAIGHVVLIEDAAAAAMLGADLVLHAGEIAPALADELVRHGQPHLAVHAIQGHGVIGPLVVPGRTACLRCVDHRDGQWRLRALEPLGHDHATDQYDGPIDALTARATATLAALQALQHLEQQTRPAAINARLVVNPFSGLVDRREVWADPDCGCRLGPAPLVTAA